MDYISLDLVLREDALMGICEHADIEVRRRVWHLSSPDLIIDPIFRRVMDEVGGL